MYTKESSEDKKGGKGRNLLKASKWKCSRKPTATEKKSEDDLLPGGDLLYKQAFQRRSGSPVAGPERPTQDVASASSVVTMTGKVIKPPQRLGL
ncbi:hypothetical protein NPIL_430401 [Nephila pilipes]|uniref:Uncharacterized protein n=1 Tax=Nephila pilipes TaxID=299642 RepID=A0A8X6MFZ0_NEPPI|nr:hypothetical protein NPIL_430401 [Nephila pilipes]